MSHSPAVTNILSPQVTKEIYLLRMRMIDDQVTIEGVEMFDLDKIDQYLNICFPKDAERVKKIKK